MNLLKLVLIFCTTIMLLQTCTDDVDNRKSELILAKKRLLKAKDLTIKNPEAVLPLSDSIILTAECLKDDSLLAAAIKIKGVAFAFLGDQVASDSCFYTAIDKRFNGDELLRAEIYTNFAEQINLTGDYDKVLCMADTAYSLLRQVRGHSTKLIEYKLALIKGNTYFNTHKNDSMQIYMDKALKLANEQNNPANIFFVYSYLGYFYYQLSEFPKAEKYFEKAYPIAESEENYEALSALLINLSGTAIGQKKHNKAIELCNKALNIETNQMQTDSKLTYIYGNRAEAYFYKKEYQKALIDANKSLVFAKKYDDATQLISILDLLGKINMKLNNNSAAIYHFEKTLENMNKRELDWNKKALIYNDLLSLYRNIGNYFNALKYSEMKSEAQDSILSKKRYVAIEDIKTKYKTEKKEQEIVSSQKIVKAQRQTIFYIALFSLLLISALIALYYLNRRKMKNQIALLEQNQENAKMFREKLQQCNGNITASNEEDNEPNNQQLPYEKIEALKCELQNAFNNDKIYLENGLTLQVLSDKVNSNTTYVSFLINKVMGRSFSDFVNFYRIEEAKRLIRNQIINDLGRQNVAIIGERCGFNSTSSFHSAFKQHVKMTPNQYRKTLKAAEV